ncbi:tyrosine-type recombinase/integrase [Spirochaeta cellobiosiphila]|uniref:tyrosine-type recombinase/integrase n=1 Tax=Spirochaeta cellobiosiphila TaxID=504483 RepID=UPI0004199AB5
MNAIYGGGLRLKEYFNLRIKDLDFEKKIVTVRKGKGGKDRLTLLPSGVIDRSRVRYTIRPRVF